MVDHQAISHRQVSEPLEARLFSLEDKSEVDVGRLATDQQHSSVLSVHDMMLETFNICERHASLMDKMELIEGEYIDTTALVDRVLSVTGNNMPEDLRCALNIIIQASPMLELIPGRNSVDQLSQDLGKLQSLLSDSAQLIAEAAIGDQAEHKVRSDLAKLMNEMKNDISARVIYINSSEIHAKVDSILKNRLENIMPILKETPLKASDATGIIRKLESAQNKLLEFINKYDDCLSEPFQQNAYRMLSNIGHRIGSLNALKNSNPLSEKEVFESKISAIEAAQIVISQALEAKIDSPQDRDILEAANIFLEERKSLMRGRNSTETLSKEKLADLHGGLKTFQKTNNKKFPVEISQAIQNITNGFLPESPDISSNLSDNELEAHALLTQSHHNQKSSRASSSLRDKLGGPTFVEVKKAHKIPLSHPKVREEAVMLKFLEQTLALANVSDADNKLTFESPALANHLKTPKSILQLYNDARLMQRDQKGWDNIHKDVQLVHDDNIHNFKINIIPQAGLKISSADGFLPEAIENKDKKRIDVYAYPELVGNNGQKIGINSHQSMDYKHVTNFAHSELRSDSGEILFSCSRHGTLLPYGLSSSSLESSTLESLEEMVTDLLPVEQWERDSSDAANASRTALRIKSDKNYRKECLKIIREAAAFERAKDVVRSIIAADPEMLHMARNGKQIEINVNQLSLLTPDYVRHALAFVGVLGASNNEYPMLQEQYKAWDKVNNGGEPIELMLGGDSDSQLKISARVNVNAFNFGVNELAFYEPFANSLASERNALAMQSLLGGRAKDRTASIGGQVGDWLSKNPNNAKVPIVMKLANQVSNIWHDQTYNSNGVEPYKIVSRIALLTHMIDNKIDFNCKSGKDRTGELDIEAKYLAAQLAMTGDIPEPDIPRTFEEKTNFFRMLVEGGNHELQKYSAGVAGFKLNGLGSLLTAISLDPAKDGRGWITNGESVRWFQGLSKTEGS